MAEISVQEYAYEQSGYGEVKYSKTFFVSMALHVLILVVIPLTGMLFSKPKKFERPKTFQLVSMPAAPAPPRRTPTPPPPPDPTPPPPEPAPPPPVPTPVPTPTPTPTPAPVQKPAPQPKTETKPAPPKEEVQVKREVEEDLSALDALFAPIQKPVEISVSGVSASHWYIGHLIQKIQSRWNPGTEDRSLFVVVKFDIHRDGSVTNVSIGKSSGVSVLDERARQAVNGAAPFLNVPNDLSDPLSITLTLRPTRRSS